MYVWARLVRVGLTALFKRRLGFLEESVVTFVVSPFDLDAYLHMNNGRYLTIMDLGRLDLMQRCGLASLALKHRWQPVVGEVNVSYRKALRLFSRFRLRTRVMGWRNDWLYIQTVFENGGAEVTRAVVRMVVLGPGRKKVPIGEVAQALGHSGESPLLPSNLQKP